MARGSLLTMALLSMAVSSLCRAGEHDIPEGYVRVAAVHGVPAEVLYAVSLTETVMAPSAIAGVMKNGMRISASRPLRPRPWTINVAGKGYRYASRPKPAGTSGFSDTVSGPAD